MSENNGNSELTAEQKVKRAAELYTLINDLSDERGQSMQGTIHYHLGFQYATEALADKLADVGVDASWKLRRRILEVAGSLLRLGSADTIRGRSFRLQYNSHRHHPTLHRPGAKVYRRNRRQVSHQIPAGECTRYKSSAR